jgi:hypothetical protein
MNSKCMPRWKKRTLLPCRKANAVGVKNLVREATEEHKIVKTLLAESATMSAQEEQYDAKVRVL